MRTPEQKLTLALYTCLTVVAAAAMAAHLLGGCATVGKAAQVLAPYIGPALAAGERFLETQREPLPPGKCEAIPAGPDGAPAGVAVAVCSDGPGWLRDAARVLSEAAEADGEGLDIAGAGCFPRELGPGFVCTAPYTDS